MNLERRDLSDFGRVDALQLGPRRRDRSWSRAIASDSPAPRKDATSKPSFCEQATQLEQPRVNANLNPPVRAFVNSAGTRPSMPTE